MAAPRATQFIALRNLSRTASSQVRSLHMTGPATYASPLHANESPVANLPRDIAGLRAECKRRKIDPTGSKQELTARLHADTLTHTRAFTTSQPTRPTPPSPTSTQQTRHINTTRALKAIHDTSTIDFAYFPTSSSLSPSPEETLRVPILPDTYITPQESQSSSFPADPPVMRPEISAMSADAVVLPMSDLHDGHGENVDFHAMAEQVAQGLRRAGMEKGSALTVDEQASLIKRVWGDLVDDVVRGLGKVGRAV